MFFDDPYLQSLFGLTVTPSVSIRKKLLKYKNLQYYIGSSAMKIPRHSKAYFKFRPNRLDHSRKPA